MSNADLKKKRFKKYGARQGDQRLKVTLCYIEDIEGLRETQSQSKHGE